MKTFEQSWSIVILVCCLPFIMAASGCPNALMESANKNSDEALLFDAEMHANNSEWTEAIADLQKLSAGGQAKRENKAALGSYYAGRCGLNLLNFANSLKNAGSGKLWPLVAQAMVGATASQFADCKSAEALLMSISATPAARTPDENILLAFIEFAKMGADLVSSGADTNGDGTLDGGFDACATGSISDANVQELGTGLTIGLNSLIASGSTAGASMSTAFDALCSTVQGSPYNMTGFCSQTSASSFTGTSLLALRALIKSNELGYNSCNGAFGSDPAGTSNDCICPVHP